MKKYKIGIDLGGTKIESILLDPAGKEVLTRKRVATPGNVADRYHAICSAVCGLVRDTMKAIPDAQDCTVGIGIPGTLSRRTQLVQNANTTCLIGKPFRRHLAEDLKRPVGMENDANCFTQAESLSGAAQGYRIVFGVIMGTGCGGGLCIDGRIHHGRHDIAGEWGHFSVDPDGAPCYCGHRGCVETKISGSGVENAFHRRFGKRLSMQEIVSGHRRGDRECVEIFEQFLEDFGRCLGGLISILDPDAVVLGGGLSAIEELYGPGLARVRHCAFHQHIETPILRNRLGDSAGVYGAAWIGL
ncbi:N-acetylglucosamine kinase [Desulfonema ishimotonii]|uniref:N-acetylglucosamine kinase n=1 Tax=Desulfonema ishimotonii TaxID=45657 RepID=A0A401FU58_9BACT|nr:ROK family protein [Desulfonema ishimotonii]GBC60493.1 N-acetylglucosamine kinase [Desulfonema ishimotonii]